MKNLFKFLTIFSVFTAVASAAPTPEKHPVDNFQIGVPTSSAQKQLLFDLGLGASNPNLGVDTTFQGLNYSKNLIQWGDGNSSNKTFTANIGSGSNNPKIIWDNTNSTWAFSNDGSNFSSFGSGSGGASGIQLLTNGDFESGITLGWTNTGGNFAVVTTGSNLLVGKKSATFTASASGQSVQSSLYPIPNGLTGQACAASMMYKGGDIGLTFEVVDNASNILASQVIQASTTAQVIALPFQCPTSGSIRVKVVSSASAALIAMDQMFLGQNTLIALSQASYFGGVSFGSNCGLTTTSGTYSDLSESGSSCTSYTLKGNASSWSHSDGTVTFNNMPPGEYAVTFNGMCWSPNAVDPQGALTIIDDLLFNNPEIAMDGLKDATGAGVEQPCILTGHFSYQTSATHTFKLHGLSGYAGVQPFGWISRTGESITVYRFPTQSELAVRPDTINWIVEAQQSGNDIDLGTTAGGTVQYAVDGSNTMTQQNFGTPLNIKQPCSGTGAPTSSTCSGGTFPQVGIVFTPPSTGKVKACAHFNVAIQSGGSSQTVYDAFKINMTDPNNEATVLQGGHDISNITNADPSSSEIHGGRQVVCGYYQINSTNPVAFRLLGEAQISAGPGLTRNVIQPTQNTGGGASALWWSVTPVTQNIPAPVIVYNPIAFSVEQHGSFGSPTSGNMDYDTVIFDTNNGWVNSSPKHYVIPSGAGGTWHFDAAFTMNDGFSYGSSTFISLTLTVNGSAAITCVNGDTQNHGIGCNMSRDIQVNPGDTIKVNINNAFCSTDSNCHPEGTGMYLSGHILH